MRGAATTIAASAPFRACLHRGTKQNKAHLTCPEGLADLGPRACILFRWAVLPDVDARGATAWRHTGDLAAAGWLPAIRRPWRRAPSPRSRAARRRQR